MNKTIEKRQNKEKEILLERLEKTPIVQIACEKCGIGRATYYRWKKEDPEFAKLADEALAQGTLLINDLAESKLIASVQNQNMTAIIFWLKHHHPAYITKVEVTANLKHHNEQLTPEQEALVTKALQLASLIPVTVHDKKGLDGEAVSEVPEEGKK